jgi:hypothetical protein
MKTFLPLLALNVLLLAGCGPSVREVSVKDVSKNETIILKKNLSQGSVSSVQITGIGSVVGKAEVQLILDGVVYKSEGVTDSVKFELGGDWYSDAAEVRYVSGTVTSGSLTLKYQFR